MFETCSTNFLSSLYLIENPSKIVCLPQTNLPLPNLSSKKTKLLILEHGSVANLGASDCYDWQYELQPLQDEGLQGRLQNEQ